jgi:hypothetical protein
MLPEIMKTECSECDYLNDTEMERCRNCHALLRSARARAGLKEQAQEALRDIQERCEHSQDLEAMRLQIVGICERYWKRSSSGGGGAEQAGDSAATKQSGAGSQNESSSATREEKR